MTTPDLEKMCISARSSLLEAMSAIDYGAAAMAFVVDEKRALAGVVTDGDIRRALLSGASLDNEVKDFMSTSPHTVAQGTGRAHIIDLIRSLRISAVPEVAADGTIVKLHSISDVFGSEVVPMSAMIMAGGKGTRLGKLTATTPKPLMKVANRPIIEWIILGLVGDGVKRIFVSVNHMADQIIDYLGDGSKWDCHIQYVRETVEKPLGTAGALTLIDPQDIIHEHMLVINADVMVEFDASAILEHHVSTNAAVTMGVFTYQHVVPYGVAECDGQGRVIDLVEKPAIEMQVNSAVYVINTDTISLLPRGEASTMPELIQSCMDKGKNVSSWELTNSWIDVGTPADLARANGRS